MNISYGFALALWGVIASTGPAKGQIYTLAEMNTRQIHALDSRNSPRKVLQCTQEQMRLVCSIFCGKIFWPHT